MTLNGNKSEKSSNAMGLCLGHVDSSFRPFVFFGRLFWTARKFPGVACPPGHELLRSFKPVIKPVKKK